MELRPLKKEDIPEAGIIVKKNYDSKDAKSVMNEMEDMFGKGAVRPSYIVAEDKGEIIGFAGYMQSGIDYALYQIFWVNVAPERQRQGIGTMLVKKVITEIKKDKKAKLILLSTTSPAFYEKHFKFKEIDSFKGSNHRHCLMSLSIHSR